MNFDWSELAFASKKPVRELRAIFIAAPREISGARFKQLLKTYLPEGNIVLGLAKEPYVEGFEGQPQFGMLQNKTVRRTIDLVNVSSSPHKVHTLHYFQRELPFILEKLQFKKVLFLNGSWQHVFHVSPTFFILTGQQTPYELLSPFVDEKEARDYEQLADQRIISSLGPVDRDKDFTEAELFEIAARSARRSYDYSFQTGLALARRIPGSKKYKLLISTFNKVVPFQTYAMHYGASREKNFSAPHDLNHYDTIHAEVRILTEAQKNFQKIDLKGTTLFINLLPCPSCARMFTDTDIEEFVYNLDHSDGYAVKLLEAAHKKVRRVVL